MDLALTPATEADREFLYELYRATMREYIERTWGWDEAWQRADFEQRLAKGVTRIVIQGGERVGAVELMDSGGTDVVIANIQVSPAHQRRGIGSSVLGLIITKAVAQGRNVSLQVLEKNTGARKLYERLGFVVTAHVPPYFRMTLSPPHRSRP